MGTHTLGLIGMVVLGLLLCNIQAGVAANIDEKKASIIKANNLFATDLYAQLHHTTSPDNLFCSPYSIFTALSMSYAGARDTTESQMAEVLHIEGIAQQIHQVLGTWIAELNAGEDASIGYHLVIANALWGQQGYPVLKTFTEILRASYGTGLTEVDFRNALHQAAQTINTWVKQHTQGKIIELIDPKKLDPSTIFVLTNAIYFKGKWVFPFDPQNTRETPFTLIDGDTVEIPMMYQTLQVKYVEDATVQVLELPYGQPEGEKPLSMLFFLPKDPAQFSALESEFSLEFFHNQMANLQEQTVAIGIPRFTVNSKFSLPENLQSLGMIDAFSPQRADFSGITENKELFISDVLHEVMIEVNEEGTEATGATAVLMSRGLAQYPVFQADHPFLVVILDNRTQGILFLGRIMDP